VSAEQDLLESAGAHAKATTKSWDWYLSQIRANPSYAYKNTQWYAAGGDLEAVKHLPPEPVVPPAPARIALQNVVFVSDTPQQAVNEAPTHYALLFSADPAYQDWHDLVARARGQGRPWLGVWCDCRSTLPPAAKRLMEQHRLDAWCGQGENDGELLVALEHGASLLVGNANAWAPANAARVTSLIGAGSLSFSQEAYTNAGNPWPEATSAGGVPAASLTIGLYDASGEQPGVGRYITVAEYQAHTPPALWGQICAYVSGLHPGELAQLP